MINDSHGNCGVRSSGPFTFSPSNTLVSTTLELISSKRYLFLFPFFRALRATRFSVTLLPCPTNQLHRGERPTNFLTVLQLECIRVCNDIYNGVSFTMKRER